MDVKEVIKTRCGKHDFNKKCRLPGCDSIGKARGKCALCGKRRRAPLCYKHYKKRKKSTN